MLNIHLKLDHIKILLLTASTNMNKFDYPNESSEISQSTSYMKQKLNMGMQQGDIIYFRWVPTSCQLQMGAYLEPNPCFSHSELCAAPFMQISLKLIIIMWGGWAS